MRRAAKVDSNHNAIVDAFRSRGATVTSTAAVGNGFPDLAVGYCGETVLVEVKDGAETFTPAQKKWHSEWRGWAVVVRCETDVELVLASMGIGKD